MRLRCALSIAGLLLASAGCSRAVHAPHPAGPAQRHAAPPRPAPSPAPRTPVPVTPPVVTPAPGPSLRVAPVPTLAKKIPRLPAGAAPRILAIAVSETTVTPGDRVRGSVVTSSNVASVEARIGGYATSLVKTGVGRFELTYTVRPLPWFIRGNFTMEVIARNARGEAVARAIPIIVR